MVADLVIQRAEDMRADRDRVYWKNMQAAVQNGVGKAFSS